MDLRKKAFQEREFRDSSIRRAKKRFRIIDLKQKEEKRLALKGVRPESTEEIIKESKLPAFQRTLVDKLESSQKFPLQQAEAMTRPAPSDDDFKQSGRIDRSKARPGFPGERHAIGLSGPTFGVKHSWTGPYTNVKLMRQALSFMQAVFPLRTCGKIY